MTRSLAQPQTHYNQSNTDSACLRSTNDSVVATIALELSCEFPSTGSRLTRKHSLDGLGKSKTLKLACAQPCLVDGAYKGLRVHSTLLQIRATINFPAVVHHGDDQDHWKQIGKLINIKVQSANASPGEDPSS